MIHQSRVAGAWYLTTYAHENTRPPALAIVQSNINYYFGPGRSSSVNWAIMVIVVGCFGLIMWSRRRKTIDAPAAFLRRLSWSRLIGAAFTILAVSNVYFLTHEARVHYYTWPALFGAVLMLALGAFALEDDPAAKRRASGWLSRTVMVIGLLLSLAPGIIVMGRVWSHYEPPSTEAPRKQFSIPPELADESAWVWATQLSGTFWYYFHKPTHKLTSTNADTRELVFKYVRSRGEPQFIVNDDPSIQAVLDEIVQLGGTLEQRGEVDSYPYYLIHWPPH
jgi:NADH:ubiquinone oxidoreductase subunit 6 (subunit J)